MFVGGVPGGQQTEQPAAVAGQAGEPGLLPRPRKRGAGAAVAGGASGVLEAAGAEAPACVTRDLLGAKR